MCARGTTNIEEKVEDIIFKYLSTPLACNKFPAELHYNRQIRTKLRFFQVAEPRRKLGRGIFPSPRDYNMKAVLGIFPSPKAHIDMGVPNQIY